MSVQNLIRKMECEKKNYAIHKNNRFSAEADVII